MSDDPLLDFVRGYREPTEIRFIAQELERLGRCGSDWPRASVYEWETRIRGMVHAGKLAERDGIVSIPPPVQKERQGLLF